MFLLKQKKNQYLVDTANKKQINKKKPMYTYKNETWNI